MDAQVAYGFHHLRNEKPYLAQGPVSNKVGAFYSLIINFLKYFWFFIKESLDLSFLFIFFPFAWLIWKSVYACQWRNVEKATPIIRKALKKFK